MIEGREIPNKRVKECRVTVETVYDDDEKIGLTFVMDEGLAHINQSRQFVREEGKEPRLGPMHVIISGFFTKTITEP
jgi:hypothetical protein